MDRFRIAALFAIVLAACTGNEGDPCQVQDDCNSGLMCCKDTASLSARGTCEEMCTTTSRRDAGPPPADTGTADAGPDDAGTMEDAGIEDAGPGDAGMDAGEPDDSGTDAGPEDAGTDAGADGD